MNRPTNHRTASRTATRIASTLLLTGALVAPWSASISPALAASHAHRAKRAVVCHHRHAGRCRRVALRRAHRHLGSAASVELLSIAPGRHGVAAPGKSRSSAPAAPSSTAPVNPSAPCANAGLVPTSENIALVDAATLCLVNQQRALHGEHALRDNAALDSAATNHSQDMVSANYFDHTSPTGETPVDRIQASGYLPAGDGYEVGENIALGTLTATTPALTVSGWMESPGHRANILNGDFVDSGMGVVAQAPVQFAGGGAGAVYTQDFGVVQSANGSTS